MKAPVDTILDGSLHARGFGQRVPRNVPTGPKPDNLTPEERAEVERRVKAGQVTRVERGQSAIDVSKTIPWDELRAQQGRIAGRQVKFACARRRAEAPDAAASTPAEPGPQMPRRSPRPLAEPDAPGLDRLPLVEVERAAARPVPAWKDSCEILLIRVARLRVAPRYQRGLGRNGLRRIRRIAEDFDWARFGAIVVRRAGKLYEVIDGQHRAAAARSRGLARVPAVVVSADGAGIFLGLNRDRANLDAAQLYHAELAAGEAEAVELAGALEAAGVSVPRIAAPRGLGPMQASAVTVLRLELRRRGAATLTAALRVIAGAWGDRAGVFSSPFIRALCRVAAEIEAAPDLWQTARHELTLLEVTLESREPEEWLRAAKAAASEHGGAAYGHLARIVANAHAAQGGVELAIGV